MFKRPALAEKTGINKQTLYGRFTEGGADLTVTEANAIIDVFNEEGIYPRKKISPQTLKRSSLINTRELWRRSGFEKSVLEALNKERWHVLTEEHHKGFARVISEMFKDT